MEEKNKLKNKFIEKLKSNYGGILVTIIGILIIVITIVIGIFLFIKGSATFYKYNHTLTEFLFSAEWNPSDSMQGGGKVGASIFICGSLSTCFLALVIAVPFAFATAIFMTEISPHFGEKIIKPTIQIFVGIPSIIYGWIGYSLICKLIKNLFPVQSPTGMSVLASGIVLALMIFPTITTVIADAIKDVSTEQRKAAYALGSTRWQVIKSVVLPSSKQGIFTGIILGLSRALGEALAVAFVIGRVRMFPKTILSPTYNITAIIAAEMNDTMSGGEKNAALWTLALLLYVMSMVFIFLLHWISKKLGAKK